MIEFLITYGLLCFIAGMAIILTISEVLEHREYSREQDQNKETEHP